MNSNKTILDLCGGTGAWSKPYKDAGYDVRLATLPDFDVTDWRNTWLSTLVFEGKVYGILAAPPCTMFSLARRTAKKEADFDTAMDVVKACFEIIWQSRVSGHLKWWAMENPRGLLRQFIGKPAFTFQQWEFGDKGQKPTDLWGYFNEPTKKRGAVNPHFSRRSWGSRVKSKKGLTRTEIRAQTPPKFARAFFEANR